MENGTGSAKKTEVEERTGSTSGTSGSFLREPEERTMYWNHKSFP